MNELKFDNESGMNWLSFNSIGRGSGVSGLRRYDREERAECFMEIIMMGKS